MTQRELNFVPPIGCRYEELDTGSIWHVLVNAGGIITIYDRGSLEERTMYPSELHKDYTQLDGKGKR